MNNTADTLNFGDGQVTLREALEVVNTQTDLFFGADPAFSGTLGVGDVIVFNLPAASTISIANGEFVVSREVVIQGPGAGNLSIEGPGSPDNRVFNIDDGVTGNIFVELNDLTITGGNHSQGAGIFNNEDLTLNGTTVTNNFFFNVGAVGFGAGIFNAGQLTLLNSVISQNDMAASDARGAGLYNAASGDVFIRGVLFDTNSAGSNTNAGGGGAIWNEGDISNLDFSSFYSNETSGSDGGGAIYNAAGATLIAITDSTFFDNKANSTQLGGGAILSLGDLGFIGNTTFSANQADFALVGGGGILYQAGSAGFVYNTTFTENSAFNGTGGGIHLAAGITISEFFNNLLAGNFDGDLQNNGNITDAFNNLFGTAVGGNAPTNPVGNIIDPNPMLAPLAANGGPTLTHALLTGSPAIDAGDNIATTGVNFDQRGPGFDRILNGTVDIGSFEFGTTVSTPIPTLAESLANNNSFTVVGATGSPTTIQTVRIFDTAGNLVDEVTPFNNLTALRVATGDFDGDSKADEFAVIGRRTNIDLRAEIVIYELSTDGQATEINRFFAFDPGIFGNGFITAGDFDGDGDDDLAVAQIGGGRNVVTLQVFESVGIGFLMGGSTLIDFGAISAPRIAAGDVDNDGLEEIIIAARTPNGADIRVFDAPLLSDPPAQQGGFVWDFGVPGYNRGAFVAAGEFDPTLPGEEIVLGSNVGGNGIVDIVNFASGTPILSTNGRLQPFGPGYNAAVRVAVGQVADVISRPIIIAGQDRLQNGEVVILARGYDNTTAPQPINPPFDAIPPVSSLLGPGGPFVASTNTGLIYLDANQGPQLIPPGTAGAFMQDSSTLSLPAGTVALPAGATFNNPNNNLLVDVRLSGADLTNLDIFLAALDINHNVVQQVQLVGGAIGPPPPPPSSSAGFEIQPALVAGAVFADVQFGDGLNSFYLDGNGQLFGFLSPVEALNSFFTAGLLDYGDAAWWKLMVVNNSSSDVTLVDWSLSFAYDLP